MLNTISKSIPKPIQFQNVEGDLINSELGRFLNSKIIEPVCHGARDRDEYVSNLFIRPKKDGKVRVILNLIQFNLDCMEHIHFKMKTLKSAVESMRQNCYFVSIDLSEAFIPSQSEKKIENISDFGMKAQNINSRHWSWAYLHLLGFLQK